MINIIGSGLGGSGQIALSGLPQRSPDVTLPDPSPQVSLPQPTVQAVSLPAASQPTSDELAHQRTEALKAAVSAALPRFFYPVSDVRFTIYKDTSGQYITRFTNIISGQTTQVPEPDLVQKLAQIGSGYSVVHTSA